jgi:membrane-associated phospholipid phosphatase
LGDCEVLVDQSEDLDLKERCYDRPPVEGVMGWISIAFGLTAVFSTLSFMYWDLPVAIWAKGLPHWFYWTMDWLTELGLGGVWLVPMGVLAIWFFFFKKDWRTGLVWLVAFGAVALTGILTNVIKLLVGRFRPKYFFRENLFGFSPLDGGHDWNFSMPSGHSTTSGAVLVILWLYFPRWRWLTVPCALVVASTRIWVRAHYISDVLTGLLVGGAVTFLIYYLAVGARWVEAPGAWRTGLVGRK